MDPTLSTRGNAKKFGASAETVRTAKNQVPNNLAPAADAKVIGLDGKKYPARSSKQKQKREAKRAKETDKLLYKAYEFLTRFCNQVTQDRWAKALTTEERAELINFLHTAANQFTLVAQELSSLNTPPQTEEPSPWQINDTTSVRTEPSFH
jgi:hypothetical protein